MAGLFRYDSPVTRVLNTLADLMLLSVLAVVFSLPLVTVGPSAAALYRCVLDLRGEKGGSVPRQFWKAFRENFRQAMLLELVMLPGLMFIGLDLWFVLFSAAPAALRLLGAAPGIYLVLAAQYVYPLQAQFENSTLGIVKNALLMALVHLPASVAVTLINFLPLILLAADQELFVSTSVLWPLAGVGVQAYVSLLLLRPVFQRYIPKQSQN